MLKVLLFLLLLLQVATLIRQWFIPQRREITPQPLEVKNATTFASRNDFESHVRHNQHEHEQMFAKLGGVERGIKAEIKNDSTQLHEKINAVDRKVASVEKSTEMQNQWLATMMNKIDRLVERGKGKD